MASEADGSERAERRGARPGAGAHVRLGHRQDQLDRPGPPVQLALGRSGSRSSFVAGDAADGRDRLPALRGVGIWGIRQPGRCGGSRSSTSSGGSGSATPGRLISAILLLLKQEWRTSINRFAEAMTLFAVACAGLFPLLHMGRPWFFYWLMPYPNTMALWPQWRSPLVWDVFAVSTYATVSLLFWYVGLIPDLATLRDRATQPFGRIVYGVLAMGWRGSAIHWHRYRTAYLLLAGLATPLVVSVHTVVSLDFTGGIIPGWHSTIFPPYFVAGAIYSGFAMVMTLAIPLRKALRPRRLHHHAPPREHGQGPPGDRPDRGLRLRDGSVLRLVQRQQVRAVHDQEPDVRAVRAHLLAADPVQLHDGAAPLDPGGCGGTCRCCSSSRSSSTSGCGWSGT